MPSDAVSFLSVDGCSTYACKDVLSMRNSTKVINVYTSPVTAKMIKGESFRDLSSLHHPRYAMGIVDFPPKSECSVSKFLDATDPLNTPIGNSLTKVGKAIFSSEFRLRKSRLTFARSLIMQCAEATSRIRALAIRNAASTLVVHRGFLLGVMRAAGTTARPLYFTTKLEVPNGGQ
jgi:hypothetical protein